MTVYVQNTTKKEARDVTSVVRMHYCALCELHILKHSNDNAMWPHRHRILITRGHCKNQMKPLAPSKLLNSSTDQWFPVSRRTRCSRPVATTRKYNDVINVKVDNAMRNRLHSISCKLGFDYMLLAWPVHCLFRISTALFHHIYLLSPSLEMRYAQTLHCNYISMKYS